MNCTEFEDRLHEQFGPSRLAVRATPDPASCPAEAADLAEHARGCPACRTLCERFQLLSDCLGAWREQALEVDLTRAIVSAHLARLPDDLSLETNGADSLHVSSPAVASRRAGRLSSQAEAVCRPTPSPHRGRSRRVVWVAAGSLVALLLAAATTILMRDGAAPKGRALEIATVPKRSRARSQPDRLAPEYPDNEQPKPADHGPVELPKRPPAAYYELAQKAAGALGEVTVFVMPGPSPKRPAAAPFTEEAAGWLDGLQHQLTPIGRGLDDAFDFLWQVGESADSSNT